MSKFETQLARRNYPQDSLKSNPAQTYDHFGFQNLDSTLEIWLTIILLFKAWLIGWRRTMSDCSDIRVFQNETIASGLSRRLVRKPGAVQRRIQKPA